MACVDPETLCNRLTDTIVEKKGRLTAIYPSRVIKNNNQNSLGHGSFGTVRSAIIDIQLEDSGSKSCISAYKTSRVDPANKRSHDYFIMKDLLVEIACYARLQPYENLSKAIFVKLGKNINNIVMEHYVSNLSNIMDILDGIDMLCICYQILHGMSYIHEENIIHRDIKDENLFITQDGSVCIGDFGLSTNMPIETAKSYDKFVGTRVYKPPEAFKEDEPYNNKFDIWSLGIIMLYFFCEKHGLNMRDHTQAIINSDDPQLYIDTYVLDTYLPILKIDSKRSGKDTYGLIRGLLMVDPIRRYSAKEAMTHPCFAGFGIDLETSKTMLSKLSELCSTIATEKIQKTRKRENALVEKNEDSPSFFRIERDRVPWMINTTYSDVRRQGIEQLIAFNGKMIHKIDILTFLHTIELFDRVLNKLEDAVDPFLLNACLCLSNILGDYTVFNRQLLLSLKTTFEKTYDEFVSVMHSIIRLLNGDVFILKDGLVTEVMKSHSLEATVEEVVARSFARLVFPPDARGGSKNCTKRSKSSGKASRKRRSH